MTTHIEVKFRELTKVDRCDRCGAEAQLLVKTPAGELLFCQHHANEHSSKLTELGWPTKQKKEDSEPMSAVNAELF